MKMTDKFLSAIVLSATLCASCTTDDLAEQGQEQGETKAVSLTATLGETPTRAGMNKGTDNTTASFYWHKSDQICVQTVNASDAFSHAQFDIASGTETGVTSATFKGLVRDKAQLGPYALYPYNENHQFTGVTALTYHLPASYTYTTVDNGIFSKTEGETTTYRTNSTNIPMVGTIADGKVAFQYLGGVAVIRIDAMPSTSGTLTISADQQLSGDFTVGDLTVDNPVIATASTETEADKKVTFTFSGATEGGVGVFYLPLATGTYSNVTIVLNSGIVNQTIDYGDLTVERATITAIPVVANRVIDGHVFVDLGLSVLWAEINSGATVAADYGNYYAWDNRNSAVSDWGSSCSVPTCDQLYELKDDCNWQQATQTNSSGQTINGYKVTSKTNGNSIFLPFAGDKSSSNTVSRANTYGYYWSSTSDRSDKTQIFYLYLYDGKPYIQFTVEVLDSYSVRPVAEKPTSSE